MKLQNYLINEGSRVATQSMIDEIADYTDNNDHFEARIQLCGMMGNIEMGNIYKSLRIQHEKYNDRFALKSRDYMEKILYKEIKKSFSNWKEMKSAL